MSRRIVCNAFCLGLLGPLAATLGCAPCPSFCPPSPDSEVNIDGGSDDGKGDELSALSNELAAQAKPCPPTFHWARPLNIYCR
jgi:hypothetical protein